MTMQLLLRSCGFTEDSPLPKPTFQLTFRYKSVIFGPIKVYTPDLGGPYLNCTDGYCFSV